MNFGKSLFNDGLCVIIICSALMWVIWTVRENEDIRGVKENEKEIEQVKEKIAQKEKKKEKRRASPSLSFFIGDQIPNTALQYIA